MRWAFCVRFRHEVVPYPLWKIGPCHSQQVCGPPDVSTWFQNLATIPMIRFMREILACLEECLDTLPDFLYAEECGA